MIKFILTVALALAVANAAPKMDKKAEKNWNKAVKRMVPVIENMVFKSVMMSMKTGKGMLCKKVQKELCIGKKLAKKMKKKMDKCGIKCPMEQNEEMGGQMAAEMKKPTMEEKIAMTKKMLEDKVTLTSAYFLCISLSFGNLVGTLVYFLIQSLLVVMVKQLN